MENYNQSSQKDENRQSGTVPSWYNLNKPYNERNRQQFGATVSPTGYSFTLGEEGADQTPGQNDHKYGERSSQRPAQYSAPDDDNLDDDDLDEEDTLDLDGLDEEEEELNASMHRQNYSSRRNGAYNDAQLTF